ncbi:glycerophosphodiester phosphodiesterase [Bacillus sp. 165]|uniref:glycerophosphodiester phosphodiesterase n=1 Tax=Bacillus sp. 165 TaxID=1529117 RepID=UPI001ADBB535|nr:glycerophosphodiester phosphodiesterase [Bacillus sp. 165]MBO9130992.1 glycerophosphodiester phosphodiesterase [Bacillus sp. 165]
MKRRWKAACGIVLAGIVGFGGVQAVPVYKQANSIFQRETKRPLVYAHQGGDGFAPSNTLEAFRLSNQLGVDGFETDVHLTKDGQVILMHDETVDRTTDGHGKVSEMTLAEIKKLDAGYSYLAPDGTYSYRDKGVKVPTLDEIFKEFPNMRYSIELKTNSKSLAEKVHRKIKQYHMEGKVSVASFHDDVLEYFQQISNREIAISASPTPVRNFVIAHLLHMDKISNLKSYQVFEIPLEASDITLATDRLVDSLHKRNIAVNFWTINDEDGVRKCLEIGADGIITDHPNIAIKVLNQELKTEK